ncbi:hypothetical protein TNCV_52211 [Trichonephila clavipes]|nr:hypothetical protein TNCV_52211 [Trichonephila clavipes]
MFMVQNNSWLACHKFEPSSVKDPSRRVGCCTLNLLKLKRPFIGVVEKLGGKVPGLLLRGLQRSRGGLVVKVTDSWLACNEFTPGGAEVRTCRGVDARLICRDSEVLPLV